MENTIENTESQAVAPSAASEVFKANSDKPTTSRTDTTAHPVVDKPKPEQQTAKPNGKTTKEGWETVDFKTDPPEKIEKRFHRLFGQVKGLQRDVMDRDDLLKQQSEVINRLSQRTEQVVSHIQNQDLEAAETKLRQARKEARERGDEDALDEINEKFIEIKAEKKLRAAQAKQQTPAPNGQQRPQNAAEAARYAASQGQLGEDDQEFIQVWQEETDEAGEPLRPWAHASDPQYNSALIEAKAVFSNPKFARKSMAEKLEEVDRRMGLERKEAAQEVMPSGRPSANLTRANGNRNMRGVQISDRAASMAVRTKFAGPGKSNDEHIEAYRQQIARVRGGLQ